MVVVVGLVEFVVGGITADSNIELYLVAWASTTGGVWFLFEKAERAASEESRSRLAAWILRVDPKPRIEVLSAKMASLFDTVFGARHLTARCLMGSVIASLASVAIVTTIWIGVAWPFEDLVYVLSSDTMWRITYRLDVLSLVFQGGTVLVLAAVFNLIPDYVSLLQTRRLLSLATATHRWPTILAFDLLLTIGISLSFMYGAARVSLVDPVARTANTSGSSAGLPWQESPVASALWDLVTLQPQVGPLKIDGPVVFAESQPVQISTPHSRERRLLDRVATFRANDCQDGGPMPLIREGPRTCAQPTFGATYPWEFSFDSDPRSVTVSTRGPFLGSSSLTAGGGYVIGFPPGVFFYSAFFTSAWLWLYAGSLALSRLLIRLTDGVGFLLHATDVERQPFRSMGFVNVICLSVIFALGLPLVIWI